MKTFMPGITLGKYLAGVYVFNLLFLMVVLLGIIYLFDTVELLRRAGSNPDISLATVLQMGLLKLPDVGQVLFPFAILFSAMFTFWQLNRRSELIVLRSAGFSVWQFILPLVAIVLLVGVLQMTVINPLGALLITKYEQLETRVLKRQDSSVALFQEGLWLRQSTDGAILDDDDEVQKGYVIVHARRVQPKSWSLQQVTVFYFGQNDSLLMRVDAPSAELEQGRWIFNRAKLHRPGIPPLTKQQITLPTTLTTTDIEESFASPESVSFWSLPSHIQTLEQTGFDANRLRVHFHSLLSQPLMFMAMVLLAATVSIRPPRFGGVFGLIAIGVGVGFFTFFVSSYLQALGASQQLPPPLAAWSPALICFLLGITVLLSLEDG